MSSRQAALLLLCVVAFSLLGFADNGDAQVPSYSVKRAEVQVTFFATDQRQRAVNAVTEDDFAIVDTDNVVRKFTSLTTSDQTHLNVAVILDASESVARNFDAVKGRVLELISGVSAIPGNQLSVLAFSGNDPILVCSQDCENPAATEKLRALKPAGPTPLFDALYQAARLMSARQTPGIRPVIILLSDGCDTISRESMEDATKQMVSRGIVLYSLGAESNGEGSHTLKYMAEATGGRFYCIQRSARETLENVLADFHAAYTVTYPLPTRRVGFHMVRIFPKHNLNLQFHCRKGYYYEESR